MLRSSSLRVGVVAGGREGGRKGIVEWEEVITV